MFARRTKAPSLYSVANLALLMPPPLLLLLFLHCILVLQRAVSCGDTEKESSDAEDAAHDMIHNHERHDHHDDQVKARIARIKAKLCAPPQPYHDMEALKRYDGCGSSLLFGRTNVRDCFTTFVGFKKRVPLERVYQLACLMNEERREAMDTFMGKCLRAIAKVAPKEELKSLIRKLEKVKTAEERTKVMKEYAEARLTCEEAALGL